MKTEQLRHALAGVPEATRERFIAFHEQNPVRRLDVGGHTLEYIAFGRGDRVILHLPGLLSNADAAVYLVPLADRARILSVTYLPTSDTGAQLQAFLRLLDAEHVSRAAVLGQTLGGHLAQCFTGAHPDRVSELVVAHAGLPLREEIQMRQVNLLYGLMHGVPFPLIRQVLTRPLLAGVQRAGQHPDIEPGQAALIQAYFALRQAKLDRRTTLARYGLLRDVARVFPEKYRAGLASWPGRTLVMYSRGQWCNEHHVARMRELLTGLTAHTQDAGAHWNLYLLPEASSRLVGNFLGLPEAREKRGLAT
ncbi:alpha/beta hydrolase [Pyxidicoccus parkwayensis]|uniref:Alpha/beta hydrolase n=1 Tax=Pyxidicoccus parkwayensis TaxID=2813578 RepID=A0ABX7P6U9_9BACT|nr:alpha/beta hydrolase [Pyxidicoccus parkwaysis]QSQ26198.1 alpha/beta hydrolase [Pyxidicoccus parkwaysis]